MAAVAPRKWARGSMLWAASSPSPGPARRLGEFPAREAELIELALGAEGTGTAEQTAVADMRMADAHRRLGDLAHRLGNVAAQLYGEQVDRITRIELEKQPDNLDWKRTLSVADVILGDLAARGDRGGDEAAHEAARQVREIVAIDGGSTREG